MFLNHFIVALPFNICNVSWEKVVWTVLIIRLNIFRSFLESNVIVIQYFSDSSLKLHHSVEADELGCHRSCVVRHHFGWTRFLQNLESSRLNAFLLFKGNSVKSYSYIWSFCSLLAQGVLIFLGYILNVQFQSNFFDAVKHPRCQSRLFLGLTDGMKSFQLFA